jgi:two-component system sensor histidine kinase/response regulator
MMGGRIWLESEPGKGSRFHFTVTFQKAAAPAGAEPLFSAGEHRVLIVDDHPLTRQSLSDIAIRLGLSPVSSNEAGSFDSLMEAAEAGKPYLFLWCDAACELLERIAGDPRLAALRVILFSAGSAPGNTSRWQRLGAAALKKPVREAELRSAVTAALATAPAHALGASANPLGAGPSGLRLLLAEDNAVNQKVGCRLLEKLGHSVVVVSNGLQAVRAVEEEDFDAIFMDVQMPELDGIEATAAIREAERGAGKHRRIIAMTAHAMKGDRERCLAAGMDGYVSKPIRVEELTAILATVKTPVA